jgi:hypothetical protein
MALSESEITTPQEECTTMNTQIIRVKLPNEAVILVRATVLSAKQDVAFSICDFGEIYGAIEGIAQAVTSVITKVKPTKASVELGLEVGVENGKLTALLVQGTATANLSIKLEW